MHGKKPRRMAKQTKMIHVKRVFATRQEHASDEQAKEIIALLKEIRDILFSQVRSYG